MIDCGRQQSRTEQDLLRNLENRGVIAIAAIGNEYLMGNPTDYPGAYDSVFRPIRSPATAPTDRNRP